MLGTKTNSDKAGITLIATNCEFSGDIHFSDQLHVNGIVKGNIYAVDAPKAVMIISEKGRVHGEIRVPNIVINGQVSGDIYAEKHIELASKAEVSGNIYYNLIEMVKGSCIDGNLVHVKDGEPLKKGSGEDNIQHEAVNKGKAVKDEGNATHLFRSNAMKLSLLF